MTDNARTDWPGHTYEAEADCPDQQLPAPNLHDCPLPWRGASVNREAGARTCQARGKSDDRQGRQGLREISPPSSGPRPAGSPEELGRRPSR